MSELGALLRASRGEVPADLLLREVQLIDVLTGEIRPTSIAVAGGRVVGFGEYEARASVDLDGAFAAPGFIDAHVHLESSLVVPARYARAVVPHGTTLVVTDCHEIANVLGVSGVTYMAEASRLTPLDLLILAPSCVPATDLETSGARLEAEELAGLRRSLPEVIGLGEVMNFPGVIHGDPAVLAKLAAFSGCPIDGHAPGLSGKELAAYAAAGIGSDHECVSSEEASEKLRAGLWLAVRQGSTARNLVGLLPAVTPLTIDRCYFCTDDRQPDDLLTEGHMDAILAEAVRLGLDPVQAVRMATINPCRFLGLKDRGALAPGRRADIVILRDLETFKVERVYREGILVAEEGSLLGSEALPLSHPGNTVNIAWGGPGWIEVPAEKRRIRVIGQVPDQIVTEKLVEEPTVRDGLVVADPARDILKLCVIERHHGTGRVGVGFVRGFGLRTGALASTVAHDSHNLVVLGASDSDILAAARAVEAMGGGQAVCDGGKTVASMALPVAGLMSESPLEDVRAEVRALKEAARSLGCALRDPFMAMSFLALPVIPELKLTDLGLFDVTTFKHVSLFE
ncbi:MAG: adenine deaminase [Candidatus Geothermincolia bacterium]